MASAARQATPGLLDLPAPLLETILLLLDNKDKAACEAACHALADVSRQSDLLWQAQDFRLPASDLAALLAWLAAHRLSHLRLACARPQDLVGAEELAAAAARMPRLESLEAPAAVLYSPAWAAASCQLSFLSLTTPTHDCGTYLCGWYLPPQLKQLAGLRALRLGGSSSSSVEVELSAGSIPRALRHFAAEDVQLQGLAALVATARSLRRLELGGCTLSSASDCAALRHLLRQAVGLTYLALEEVRCAEPSSDGLAGRLLQDVGALSTLRVLKLEGVMSWPESTAASMSSLTALSLGYGVQHELLQRLPPAAPLHTLLLACGDPSASVDWPGFGQALRQLHTLVLPLNELRHLVQHQPDGQPSQPSQCLPSVQRLVLLNGAYTLGPGQRAPTAAQLRDGCQLLAAIPAALPALRELVFRPQVLDAITGASESRAHLAALLAAAPHLRVSTTTCPSAWQRAAGATPCPCCL